MLRHAHFSQSVHVVWQRFCDPATDLAAGPLLAATGTRPSVASLFRRPEWLLPRALGPWAGPSIACAAAIDTAASWRRRGFTVEMFTDAVGRPAFRDRILPDAGYREARLLCTHGGCEFTADVPHASRPLPASTASSAGDGAASLVRWLGEGEWVALRIGRWHAVRAVAGRRAEVARVSSGEGGGRDTSPQLLSSWLYVMR